jgi:hypothetical protein
MHLRNNRLAVIVQVAYYSYHHHRHHRHFHHRLHLLDGILLKLLLHSSWLAIIWRYRG